MKKVSARWAPKLLLAVQRQERVHCASEFLDLCGPNPKEVIERLVTGDETMSTSSYKSLDKNPESKRESMKWGYKGEKPPRKAKVQQSTKKVMCAIFWDFQGIFMVDLKERNTVVNGEYYASLKYKLRDMIGKTERQGVLLLHDNASVHTAAPVFRRMQFVKAGSGSWTRLLFIPKFKAGPRGIKFSSEKEWQAAIFGHFEGKDCVYFYKGLEILVHRCQKCVSISGDLLTYIENLYSHFKETHFQSLS